MRGRGGAPTVFLEESIAGARGGSSVGGTGRCCEEDHDGLEMIAKQSNCETGGSGEAVRTGTGCRDGEEQV